MIDLSHPWHPIRVTRTELSADPHIKDAYCRGCSKAWCSACGACDCYGHIATCPEKQ